MEIKVKHFSELTADEVFEIYKLRIAVFVVEQNCPYQDIDDFDKVSYHILGYENGKLIAYARLLPEKTVFDTVSIGRVISVVRRKGNATLIVKQAIKSAYEKTGADKITIEAQTYAKDLYLKLGFEQVSGEFLEDGIPHIKMVYTSR